MIFFAFLLVLFACVAFAGWCFGAIRAATSFVGLLLALIVARIFSHVLGPALGHVGVKSPTFAWLLGPVAMFLAVLVVVKPIGYVVQRKVNLYYKYKAGDLRMGLWNRLNPRLGLCLGLANAAVYAILISLVLYIMSYPTVQLVAGNHDHWSVRMLNEAGRALQSCGLTKVAAAVDPMPETYYEGADLAGLLYHNELLEARLARYPDFIALGETPEFKAIGADKNFRELRQKQPPFMEIVDHPLMQPIVGNSDKLAQIWDLLTPDFQDLQQYLQTGVSEKFAAYKLVGRWNINYPVSFSAYLEAKPTSSPNDMRNARREMSLMFTKTTTLVATRDNKIYLKNIGNVSYVTNTTTVAPTPASQPARGGAPGGRGGAPGGRGGPGAYNPQGNASAVFGFGGGGGGGGRGPAPTPAPAPAATTMRTAVQVTPSVKFDNLQGSWQGQGTNYQILPEPPGSSRGR